MSLQAQSGKKINLWQRCQEIVKKGAKIVALGAPLFCMICML